MRKSFPRFYPASGSACPHASSFTNQELNFRAGQLDIVRGLSRTYKTGQSFRAGLLTRSSLGNLVGTGSHSTLPQSVKVCLTCIRRGRPSLAQTPKRANQKASPVPQFHN
jgi:hypothetical protein